MQRQRNQMFEEMRRDTQNEEVVNIGLRLKRVLSSVQSYS